ncbi:hypothetical protein H7F37_09005 [Winogradskyella sp. PAMC22761]|nr:hypothetical protein H7F37_09005 [Winogradskyella sp. PAMC22761]
MIKLAKNLFILFLVFINLANAQDKLNKENKFILNKSVKTILDTDQESDDSYLLSFDDEYDDAFFIYKFENDFIININEYTFKTTDITSNDYKIKISELKGKNTSYKQINNETGETIKEIPSYKFVIPLQKTDQLETVIVSLLLKNINTQPKLIFKHSGI